jgi:hypothetical protein
LIKFAGNNGTMNSAELVHNLHKEKPMNEMPVMQDGEGIMLFYPHVPQSAIAEGNQSIAVPLDWARTQGRPI